MILEIIRENLALLSSIFVMLLGAFLIGYYSGNTVAPITETEFKKAHKKVKKIKTSNVKKSDAVVVESNDRVEISDLSEPGHIRAKKTRERAGRLSEEMRNGMASQYIDFSTIGYGDPSHPDDLKKVVGIGSFVEEKLNAIGIQNYSQLANMTDDDIRAVTKVIEFFPGRIHRDDWKGQAQDLLASKE